MIGSLPHSRSCRQWLALKDGQLVYRACTRDFASRYARRSPDRVIGATDFALLERDEAREQLVLDSRVMHSGRADIGIVHTDRQGRPLLIVREPVVSQDQRVQGIDIRLVADLCDPHEIAALVALVEAGATLPEGQSLARLIDAAHARPAQAIARAPRLPVLTVAANGAPERAGVQLLPARPAHACTAAAPAL